MRRYFPGMFLVGLGLGFVASCTSGESPVLSSVDERHYIYNCSEITENASSPMGINLIFLSHFANSNWLFVDAFTKSSSWIASSPSLGWGQGTISSQDSLGWPTGIQGDTRPTVQMFTEIDGQYPAGTYVVHWEGSGGTLEIDGDGTNLRCADGQPITNCPGRRGLFDVTSPSREGLVLSIIPDSAATYSASNYLRNIRVIMPGGMCGTSVTSLDRMSYCATSRGGEGSCASGLSCQDFDDIAWDRFSDPYSEVQNPKVVFHPHSVRKLRPFRAIRYQEYLHMQGTGVTSWSSRTPKEASTWTGVNGGPPELTVHLSNLVDADAWLNIPHMATDDYVTNFASYTHSNLQSNLDIYLEYSNEPWNPSVNNFPQSQYFLDQAEANNIGVGREGYIRKSLAYAERAVEVFDVWNAVYGADASKVSRLLSSWGGFNDVAPAMLDHVGTSRVDAIAVGPYIGIYMSFAEHESVVENWTKETVFREIYEGILNDPDAPNGALAAAKQMITDNAAIASQYGVDLLGYEAGTHLWAEATETNTRIRELFRNTVTDSRLGQVYLELFNHWRELGGKLINHFAFVFPHRLDQFGMYPHENARCEDYPKIGSIYQFLHNNACWWTGCERN